jgi:hypothetical protein
VDGIVFAALRDFLTSHLGADRADAIFGAQPPYLMSAAYSDADFLSLVERARMLSDQPLESFLQAFGVFTGSQTFPRLYPAYYDLACDTRTSLLTVESRIHELVRATIPNAVPDESRPDLVNVDRRRDNTITPPCSAASVTPLVVRPAVG